MGWVEVNPIGQCIYCPPCRHASPDGGGTAPSAKFWRAPLLPPEFSWGALANVSAVPARPPTFLAGAGGPINLARARLHGHQKPPFPSAAAKTFLPAASNGAHRQQQVGGAQGARPGPLPRGRRGGRRQASGGGVRRPATRRPRGVRGSDGGARTG
jgi:hypothetical protein